MEALSGATVDAGVLHPVESTRKVTRADVVDLRGHCDWEKMARERMADSIQNREKRQAELRAAAAAATRARECLQKCVFEPCLRGSRAAWGEGVE